MQAPPGSPGTPGTPPPGAIPIQLPPGQTQPTPEQIQAIRQQIAEQAQKAGIPVEEFVARMRQQAIENQRKMQEAMRQRQAAQGGEGGGEQGHNHQHQHGGGGQSQPIQPGPPNPVALAVAKFLTGQDLKPRTVILNGERRDMFRVKRALRALESPAYAKARKKNPALPEITDRASLENAFKLLPLSMLALRVNKHDPHEGHNHAPKKGKRVKGQWTVQVEREQEAKDDMYYVWLWEGPQLKKWVYSGLITLLVFIGVLYPLWPLKLRLGVYYLSWGFLCLLGLFFLMAIFRVILFGITYFIVPPGLWLYPNLWEDVSFMDSFRPIWAWHETEPKKKKKKSKGSVTAQSTFAGATGQPQPATASTTATATTIDTAPQKRYSAPKVEEGGSDDE